MQTIVLDKYNTQKKQDLPGIVDLVASGFPVSYNYTIILN